MRHIVSLLIVLPSLAFAPAPVYRAKTDNRTDLEKMQGKWIQVDRFRGRKRDHDPAEAIVVTVKGDIISFGAGEEWRFTLDATKSPKRFDGNRVNTDHRFWGIYHLKGDKLVICWHLSSSQTDRPVNFDYKQPGVWLHVFERKKP